MKIAFTGGGTAGHVTPNIAIMAALREKNPDASFVYIGSDGIEKTIICKMDNIPYYTVRSGKFRRYFSLKNLTDPFRIIAGYFDAKKALKKEKPDVLFSKGGFVSVPVVYAAAHLKIPVISHESDITPGLANKLSAKYASRVCTTFSEANSKIPKNKGIFTGSPIRRELFLGNAERARASLGFDDKPVMLVMGGSVGSVAINNAVRANLKPLTEKYNIIHLCGKNHLTDDPDALSNTSYRQFEFISEELPDCLNLASFIVSRAGSNAIHEFLALRKPMLLIPLPLSASRGDQILNAQSFKERNFARVLEEEKITEETLMKAIEELCDDSAGMIASMEEFGLTDASGTIADIILSAPAVKKK